jgi:tripartite-type tricarboxylate transporter receptor subunit TctC
VKKWIKRAARLACVAAAAVATVAAVVLGGAISFAHGQPYPAKPVRIIVPIAAGGATDIMARAIAQKLSESFGLQVLVENRPGANAIIGAEAVAKSPADGYTLLFTPAGTFVNNPFLYSRLPYDAAKDFAPVVMCCTLAQAIVVHPSLNVGSLQELIALAKAKPGVLTYASTGRGSTVHINMEAFRQLADIDIVHVPYKGSAPAITDLIAGRVSMTVVIFGVVQDYLRAGRLKALAVGAARRASMFPEVPTAAEAGLPGYDASAWIGLFAPSGTPPEIVSKLNLEVRRVIANPQFSERWLVGAGLEPPSVGSPEQFDEFIRADMKRWAKIIKASGARLD